MNGDEAVIPIFFFFTVMVVLVVYFINRHRERMSVIAKGLGPDEIKALYTPSIKTIRFSDPLTSLKWGILFVFAGIAVLLGTYLSEVYHVQDSVIIGMICVFVGLALVIFYGIAAKQEAKQQA